MTNFKKIDLKINLDAVLTSEKTLMQTITRDGQENQSRLKYSWLGESIDNPIPFTAYSLDQAVVDDLINQLPKAITDIEKPNIFYINMGNNQPGVLPPHVDRARRCAINIYLECNDEITEFYMQEGDDLQVTDRFVAKSNEVWALDVSKIHAVIAHTSKARSAVSISFRKLKFDQLIKLL